MPYVTTTYQNTLKELLEQMMWMGTDELNTFGLPDQIDNISNVSTFEEAGILTTDAGIVIDLVNGQQLQVTIIRSR